VGRLLACLLLVANLACAGEIRDSSVVLEDGVYRITAQARIHAPMATVIGRITDYNNLTRINHSIEESRIIQTFSPDRHRVHSIIRACILFFCRRVTQVQDIEQQGKDRVEASILPELSDFRYGHAVWQLAADGTDTLMDFSAQLEPSFWVPPLIGPWLFENKIVSELLDSATIIEADWRGTDRP
jgi:hypothetical protein